MKVDPEIKEELVGYLKTHDVKKRHEVIKRYIERRTQDKKRQVTIISPYKLDETEIAIIKDRIPLIKKSHGEIKNKVDPNLTAGVIIKFGSKIMSLTLESQLSNLKKILYESG